MSSVLPGLNESSLNGFVQSDEQIQQHDLNRTIISSTSINVLELSSGSEWRIEIANNESIIIRVTEGMAEIFGTELPNNVDIKLKGAMRTCIFTYQGCKLQYKGTLTSQYVSQDTCMTQYLNLHSALENQRIGVSKVNWSSSFIPNFKKVIGPRVLILGGKDSGKSSLSKILTSYANKMGRQPILVNLNPRESQFSIPGTLTATPISDIFDVENINYGDTGTTGSNFYHPKQPLVENFGLEIFSENLDLYLETVKKLSESVMKRIEQDIDVCNSGIIVDTPVFSNDQIDIIKQIIQFFKINLIININEDFSAQELKKLNEEKTNDVDKFQIINVKKSSGCYEKEDQFLRMIQQRCIREYFYGTEKLSLSPYTISVSYRDLILFKPFNVKKDQFELSLFLQDHKEIEDSSIFQKLLPLKASSSNLNNSILSIVDPKNLRNLNNKAANKFSIIQNIINETSCMGFVCVLHCDDVRERCKILLPSPGSSLPSNYLILTDFRYYE